MSGKKWFFMKEYPSEATPSEAASSEPNPSDTKRIEIKPSSTETQETINELHKRVEELENKMLPKLEEMDRKLDKLIQSNKSLIAYFSAVSNRDARDLNYRIRGFSSKSKHLSPVSFVPDRRVNDI